MIDKKPPCPKCGSKNVSGVMPKPPLRGRQYTLSAESVGKTSKQWPEPHNDDPPDKVIRPKIDFNHQYYCNSCGHYFGGSWGGA